jgi:hypothetical protein
MEAEGERLRKTREDLFTLELTITSQEGTLERPAIELASKERASPQGAVAGGCKAPGTSHHTQDSGGAPGSTGSRSIEGHGFPRPG